MADIDATYQVLVAQLKKYDDLPQDMHALGAYCYPTDPSWVCSSYHFIWNDQGEIICNFSKAKGTTLKETGR